MTTPKAAKDNMATNNATNINDIDLAKIDLAALKRLVDTATAAFEERKVGELKTLVNGWLAKADAVGYTIDDVLLEVRSRKPQPVAATPAAKRTRAPNGSKPAKEYKDADSTGGRPVPGSTYETNGMKWTKSADGKGAAKKEFLEVVKAGATWESMLVK